MKVTKIIEKNFIYSKIEPRRLLCFFFPCIFLFTNCWYGIFQSAKLLQRKDFELEPIITLNAINESNQIEDINNGIGLRYSYGCSDKLNVQMLYIFNYSLINLSDYNFHHIEFSLKQSIIDERIAFLYTAGYENNPYFTDFIKIAYAPIFTKKLINSIQFSLIPSLELKMNIKPYAVPELGKYVIVPSYSIHLNFEKKCNLILVIPEVAISNAGNSLWSCTFGIGIALFNNRTVLGP